MAPIATIFIDANESFRRMATRLFTHHFQDRLALAAIFTSWAEAVQHPSAPPARLVLLGIGSEGAPDTASIAALRTRWLDVAIVVLVYLDTPLYRHLLLTAGADAVVAKEQIAIGLLPAVEHALINRSELRISQQ